MGKDQIAGASQKWQFKLRIDGFDAAYFTKCGVPSVEAEVVSFSGSGNVHDQKFPGRLKYNEITAEKVVKADSADLAAVQWLTSAVNPESNEVGSPSSYKKTVELERLDRRQNVVERWILHDAWVSKIESDDFEGSSSDLQMEKLTIQYDYFTKQ